MMEISYDRNVLHKHLESKKEFLQDRAQYLLGCLGHILLPKVVPPTTVEDAEWIYDFPPKLKSWEEHREWANGWIHRLKEPDGYEKAVQDFSQNEYEEELFEFYSNGFLIINRVKVNDDPKTSFESIISYSTYVRDLYNMLIEHDNCLKNWWVMHRIEYLAKLTLMKGYELVGYWTAKMEERKRNMINILSSKSRTVLENREKVKELLKEQAFIVDRDFIIKAMKSIDRGERTVKNIVKDISKEKGI